MLYSLRNIIIGNIVVLAVVLLIVFFTYFTLVSQQKEQTRISKALTALQRLQPAIMHMQQLQIVYLDYADSVTGTLLPAINQLVSDLRKDSATLSNLEPEHAATYNKLCTLIHKAIAPLPGGTVTFASSREGSIPQLLQHIAEFTTLAERRENENREILHVAYNNSFGYTRQSFTFVRFVFVGLLLLMIIAFIYIKRDVQSSKRSASQLKEFNESLEKKVKEQTAQLVKEKNLSDTLINSLPGVFFVQDTTGKYLRWNRELERISGYSPEEMSDINALDFFEEQDRPAIIAAMKQAFREGSTQVEANAITKSGEKIPFYFSGQFIEYEGKPCIIGTGINITERKKVEAENERMRNLLKERIKELTTLYRSSQVLQTEEKPISWLLSEIVSILPTGWQHNEITAARIKLDSMEFTTPNFGEAAHKQTALFRTPDGNEGVVEVIYLEERPVVGEDAFYHEERDLINMIADMIRVSLARKHETEALRKSEANLHTIFDTTDTIYVLLDNNFRIISYNQRAADFTVKELGVPIESLRENFMMRFSPERSPVLGEWLRKATPGDHVMYETSYAQGNQTVNWYYVRMFPITGTGENVFGLMLAISDVTETKRLEHEILAQQVEGQKSITRAVLKAQESERNKIAQELHDNVNQILASTKLYLSMAIADHPNNIDFLRQSLGFVENAIAEIRALSSKEVSPLKEINLQELIRSLMETLSYNANIKTIFEYNIPAAWVLDEDLKLNIYRIVQEEVNNMLKHSRATSAGISLSDGDGYLYLRVWDNGVGFDPRLRRKGIGISNIINRVESYNGDISIVSSPGNGCRTEIRFPHA
jgi:PAS domain S-box-containing protein